MTRRKNFLATMNAIAREASSAQRQAKVARQRKAREIQREYQQRAQRASRKTARSRAIDKGCGTRCATSRQSNYRAAKEAEKAAKQAAKVAKERYLLTLAQSVADRNAQLSERMDDLHSVLEHTLTIDDAISFDSLRPSFDFPPFSPPANLTQATPEPRREDYLAKVKKPNGLNNILPITRNAYEKALKNADAEFEAQHRVDVAVEANS